jgi:hopene-associated glycosyltransferase HpnB
MTASNLAALLAGLSLVGWLYLMLGRDAFWRAVPRLDAGAAPEPASWPEVVAVVPARDEAETIEAALVSLLAQDYPGELRIVVVDDHSADATPMIARRLREGAPRPLEIVAAPPLPPGWSGKLWALAAGLRHAAAVAPGAPWRLLTDADIAHDPASLRRLVAKALAERLDLVSLMVRLRCASGWERLLMPAFVFFFQKLYPFPAVNDPSRRVAAAAGGCMLVRAEALAAAGGLAAIRGALIDDVALARLLKGRGGRIWLGLSSSTRSLRAYRTLGPIWAMVARTADTQLGHSLLLLGGTVLAMALLYLVPPLVLLATPLHRSVAAAIFAALAWALLAWAYRPTVRLYRLPAAWVLTLPLAALLFVAMTADSAVQHRRGRGGAWKGRVSGCGGATRRRDSPRG